MYTYIYKHTIYRFSTPLNKDSYLVSTNEADQDTHYVLISEERAKEIEDKQATPTIPSEETEDIEEQRRLAYESEADKYLIAYQGYLLEGDEEKAEEQKQLYLDAKQRIREQYPLTEDNQ